MAQKLNFTCSCGYEKLLNVGEGRMAIDENFIRRKFSPEELDGFERAVASGSHDYRLSQGIAYCKNCADIVSTAVLKYNSERINKPCPECGKTVTIIDEKAPLCPKCSKPLRAEQGDGLWD